MIDVAAGGDGTLYFLTSAQSVYQMSPGGSAHLFTQVTSVSRMAGAPDGTVYLLNTARQVFQVPPGGPAQLFTQVTSVLDIAAALDGTVYLLNTTGQVFYVPPGGSAHLFTQVTNVIAMEAGGNGSVYFLNAQGQIFQLMPGAGVQQIGQGGISAPDKSIWYLGAGTLDSAGDRAIYRLSSGQLTQVPGAATRLGSSGGSVLAVTGAGELSVASPQGLRGVFNSAVNEIAGFAVDGESLEVTSNSVSFSTDVPELGEVDFVGTYDPNNGQWSLQATVPGPIEIAGGWVDLTDLSLTLTNNNLTADGRASFLNIPELANANMHAQLYSDGRFIASIDAHELQLGGYSMSNTTATLSNNNSSHLMTLTVQSTVGIAGLGLSKSLSGVIDANGNYDLKDTVNVAVGGYTFQSVTLELKNSGLTLSGSVQVPGIRLAQVSGSVGPDGKFSLTGTETFSLGGFSLENASVTVNNSGISVSGLLHGPAGVSAQVSGTIEINGGYSLTGSATLGGDLTGTAALSLSGTATRQGTLGIQFDASVGLGVGGVTISGSINANLQVTVGSGGVFNYAGGRPARTSKRVHGKQSWGERWAAPSVLALLR